MAKINELIQVVLSQHRSPDVFPQVGTAMSPAEADGSTSQGLLSNHQKLRDSPGQILSPWLQVLVFVPKVGPFSL